MIKPAKRLHQFSEYYFSVKLKEIEQLRAEGKDIINLGIGSPDLSPDHSVIEELQSSASQNRNHGYQPYNGTRELRISISEWLKKFYNIEINPQNEILPLMGSKEGILHISMAFLNPGDLVLVPELGYPAYKSISKMLGAQVLEYPLNGEYYPDFNGFTDEMKNAKILWCNYPHMPTGTAPDREIFKKIVDFGLKENILICHDNPYSLLLNEKRMSIIEFDPEKRITLELNSLSKSHNMAGWRIGWVSGHEMYIKNLLKVKSNIDSGMFKGLQDAAVIALKLHPDWHIRNDKIYRERQSLAFKILESLNCRYNTPQSGMFVWGQLPSGKTSVKFTNELLYSKNIFITPGNLFGEMGDGYIRISLCVDKEIIMEAFKRLEN